MTVRQLHNPALVDFHVFDVFHPEKQRVAQPGRDLNGTHKCIAIHNCVRDGKTDLD